MFKLLLRFSWALSGMLFILLPQLTRGQAVSLTTLGSAYTQDFSTLSNTAGSTTNNLTIVGWFLTETGGGARDNEQYAVDTGSSTTGDMYSYGAAASTDRALGQLRSGTLIPVFGAAFTNNTGSTINSLAISYAGEQWRLGTAGRTDRINFEYSTDATSLTTGNWASISDLDFVTSVTAIVGAKDGNDGANRIALSTTIGSQSITNGATFWIRWIDVDASGADDGLAVDDFSLTPQAVITPSLSINDVSLNEGNAGTTTFTFSVSLSSAAPAGGVTFDIATADGTAAAPGDYTTKSLTSQTIPAGSSTYTFSVLVNGDTSPETNETFFVNVTNVTGANVTDGQGQGTIVNDDAAPDLTISNVLNNEGNAGTTSFIFTVSLSAPAPPGGVSLNYATSDGTAIASGDYTSAAGSIIIPQGSSTRTFSVLVNGDTSPETDETFFVNVTDVTNANVTDGQGQGTIVNDDVAPPIFATIAGNNTICSGQSTTLNVSITNGTSPYSLTISDGTSTQEITGYVSGDAITVTPSQSTTYTIAAITDAGNTSADPSNLSGEAVVTIDQLFATLSPSEATITCNQPTVSLTATGGTSYTLSDGQTNTTGVFSVSVSGGYSVTVANASGCTAIATTFVSINDSTPEASLDANTALSCANPVVTLTASPAELINYVFSANATQVGGSDGNTATVTQAGTYSVIITGFNGCTASASVTVDYEDLSPTVSINPTSATLSCSNPVVELIASGEGQLLWSTGETSSLISVTAGGTYSVTLTQGNGCSASAVAEVSQDNSIPTVSITPSSTTLGCSTTSVTLSAVGDGTFVWSTGETTSSISVTAAGPYSVTLTGANGCTATASAQVFQDNSIPSVSINPTSATLTCANPSVTLNAVGSGAFVWSTGATTQSINVASSGPYSVTLTGSNGCTATATAQVSQDNTPPTVNVTPASATLSCAISSVSLSAVGQGTYLWSTGATTPSISATLAGIYSVTLTGSNGCTATASAQVFQDNDAPTVSITPASATLSCSITSVTLTAVGTGTFVWSTGATTSSITATVAGTYSVTITATNGCTATASAQVSQDNSVPQVSITPASATLTCASPSATLTANGSGMYLWSTGATTTSISATSVGTYSVTITATNGCTATASAQVFQDNSVPTVSITPSSATLSCASPSVSLTAVGTGTFVWSTGATTSSITATVAGTYSVTLTGSNGCTATASAQVFQDNSVPSVSITPASATLSCTNSSVSLSAVGQGTFVWSTGATTQTISVTAAGTYSVTLTGSNGCTATASAQVSQDNSVPTVSITPSSATLTCASPSVNLTANGAGTYRWSTGATTQTISVSAAATYSVTLTAGNGCTATASANVTQDSSVPTVSITPASATLSCSITSVTLMAVGNGTFVWSTGATTSSITATVAGTYSVTITATNGCTATASAQVSQDNSVPQVSISAAPSLTIAAGQSTTLTASGATTYIWSTGANTTSIVVNTAGVYAVTGTTGNCSAQASVTVIQTNPPAGPFAITTVTTNTCQQIASNRYVISFTPQYSGLNGQPVSVSVVNEMFPTTAPGPYTLQLYNDNPVIVIKAQQTGTPGEVSYTYNWLANCTAPQPNTPPRVNQPLVNQLAKVGQEFGYTISQNTFTDNESPHSLVLTVSGLPAGLTFSPPVQIGGVPSVSGVSSVTVTATDPGGLSVSATFVLTVVDPSATNTPPIVANPIGNQFAIQEQPFSLNVGNTFTDAQTPNALTLTVNGQPAGLNLVGNVLSGTPSQTGTSTVTLTATDPGGLSASTSFALTVQPASATASAPFAITAVDPLVCTQISHNRYEITFMPRYSGLNGQPVSFSVVNELFPTTAPGPYSLQLYNDNPTIVLRAKQEGSLGESSYTYNWLANCTAPQPNTPPRVTTPLTDQTAVVGQGFGYTIPQNTFTDNESPHTLVLTVSGLPAGLTFSPPVQIGGVPSVSGVSSVTVTATDPGGLSVFTTFLLTVTPTNSQTVNPGNFSITGVQTLSCTTISAGRRSISFQPQYSNVNGQPIRFSVVNELLPTNDPGPYTLQLYTDNPTITLKATQQGTPGEASFSYNWLAACGNPGAREAIGERTGFEVVVLGNPITNEQVEVEIRNGQGQSVRLNVVDERGRSVSDVNRSLKTNAERVQLPLKGDAGIYLLQVTGPAHQQTIKVVKH